MIDLVISNITVPIRILNEFVLFRVGILQQNIRLMIPSVIILIKFVNYYAVILDNI